MTAATSLAAYSSLELTELENKVLEVIALYGEDGCISDEVRESFPELSYSSVTARFVSLEQKGAICRNGDTRTGASGRQQQVMRIGKYAVAKPPVVATKPLNPFQKGVIFAAKLVAKSKDLDEARRLMRGELSKIKGA